MRRVLLCCGVVLIVLSVSVATASAVTKNVHGTMAGSAHLITGSPCQSASRAGGTYRANHLGPGTILGRGTFQMLSCVDSNTGNLRSSLDLTRREGSELHAFHDGSTGSPTDFTITGGSGKCAGVTGHLVLRLTASNFRNCVYPGICFDWDIAGPIDGRINLPPASH